MIGILGGTFDPVHFGHLRPALDIQQALGLEEVRLVPCNIPPHRPQPVASREQRVAMLKAAASQHPVFRVDTREFDREGPSYTLDTLKSFRDEMGETALCLIMGLDAFISGEISEQTVHVARECGIHYFAAGHHATERYGAMALGEHLASQLGIRHQFIDIDNPV